LNWRFRAAFDRIWVRLLLVNVVVVLVPIFGLEFARTYEKQLLIALERDMEDQAELTRALLEDDLRHGVPLGDARHGAILESSARATRTRVRVVDATHAIAADSHAAGAPEGPEPEPPHLIRRNYSTDSASDLLERSRGAHSWPVLAARREVASALAGTPATETRIAHRPKAVFLFLAIPVTGTTADGKAGTVGAVYVTRSTTPVLVELYRVRSALFKVLAVALALSIGTTLLLALSISRPLALLSKAAGRIARGERGVVLPSGGRGEIAELSRSFRTMTEELDRRLVYISDFSADVAHEFKSPLTSIRGAAELLAEGAHEDAAARSRFLENILLDTERLDRLVSRLLVLSRIEASAEEPTLVDLRRVVENVVTSPRARGKVRSAFAAGSAQVLGREADLETALHNLVENALRHSPPGQDVTVTLDDHEGGVRIVVRDRGPGIPEARLSRIFDRFYTTEAEQGGTGLGLAIVDSVSRAHGGRITVDTQVDAGASFALWLPKAGG
jgi:two-component system sensor histidine kinase ChvG